MNYSQILMVMRGTRFGESEATARVKKFKLMRMPSNQLGCESNPIHAYCPSHVKGRLSEQPHTPVNGRPSFPPTDQLALKIRARAA